MSDSQKIWISSTNFCILGCDGNISPWMVSISMPRYIRRCGGSGRTSNWLAYPGILLAVGSNLWLIWPPAEILPQSTSRLGINVNWYPACDKGWQHSTLFLWAPGVLCTTESLEVVVWFFPHKSEEQSWFPVDRDLKMRIFQIDWHHPVSWVDCN